MNGNDTMDGGLGGDLMQGDERAVIAPTVVYASVSSADQKALADEPDDVAWHVVDLRQARARALAPRPRLGLGRRRRRRERLQRLDGGR